MAHTVVKEVALKPHHQRPGRTQHSTFDGQTRRGFEPFVSLQITQYDGDPGYYLFHITKDGAVADTWHETLEEALHQATYEFDVKPEEWTDVT